MGEKQSSEPWIDKWRRFQSKEARLVEDCSRVLVPDQGQEWRDCCNQCRGAVGLWVTTSAKPRPKQGEGPRIWSQRDSKSTPMRPSFLIREENNCLEYVLEWLLKHFANRSQVLDKRSLPLRLISCMRLWPDVIPCKGTRGCGPRVSLRGQMGQGQGSVSMKNCNNL